ncbi:MAG: HD domain-containing protein [Elusimicrobiales bacterium]
MKDKILTELRVNVTRPGLEKLLDFLTISDFFIAPASTTHHLAVRGGLAAHSWIVYQSLKHIAKEHITVASASNVAICGLLHDICKVNFYKPDSRNKKVDGVWQAIPGYAVDDQDPLGHGEKSVIILQRFIGLTKDEALAIRWHMGAWDAEGYMQRQRLSQAIDACPLLRALMLADQFSTYFLETNLPESHV